MEVEGDGGDQQRGISLSKCSKTKIRKMYVNSIAIKNFFKWEKWNWMPSCHLGRRGRYTNLVEKSHKWIADKLLVHLCQSFTTFQRGLQMHFLHSTSETKEINNLLLCHQLIMAPDNPWLWVFKSRVLSSPWVCGRYGDVLLSNGSATSAIKLGDCVFHPAGPLSYPLACSLRCSQLTWGEMLYGETHVGRNLGRPPANSS